MSTDAEMLAEVPLFAQLSESERALLAERIDVITVEAGITMFHHGDPGGTLYVIRSGEVELFFKNDTGRAHHARDGGRGPVLRRDLAARRRRPHDGGRW